MTLPDDHSLFKGLVFYLEIFQDGKSASDFFQQMISDFGGKVSRRLGGNVTHLVWANGRQKTLQKMGQYPNMKIVSVLWF